MARLMPAENRPESQEIQSALWARTDISARAPKYRRREGSLIQFGRDVAHQHAGSFTGVARRKACRQHDEAVGWHTSLELLGGSRATLGMELRPDHNDRRAHGLQENQSVVKVLRRDDAESSTLEQSTQIREHIRRAVRTEDER